MKYLALAFVGVAALSGCVDESPAPKTDETSPAVGLANPASAYCSERGGSSESVKSAAGEVSMCHLPDGTVVEEWELFRANHKG